MNAPQFSTFTAVPVDTAEPETEILRGTGRDLISCPHCGGAGVVPFATEQAARDQAMTDGLAILAELERSR